MQNISVPWMIKFSSHKMKDMPFKKCIALLQKSKPLVKNQTTQNENTLGELFFLQTT